MDLVRVIAPAVAPLSLDEVKGFLNVEYDDADVQIQRMMNATLGLLDGPRGLLGRCLINQQWRVAYDFRFPSWRIELPLSDLVSVDSVEYVDANGDLQTLDPSVYEVFDGPKCAFEPSYLNYWPAPRAQSRAVRVTFTAGYGVDPDDVPDPLISAMEMMVSHLFEHREAVVGVEARDSSTALPYGFADLISPFNSRKCR